MSWSDLRWVGKNIDTPTNIEVFFSPGVFAWFPCSDRSENSTNRKLVNFYIKIISQFFSTFIFFQKNFDFEKKSQTYF